jgi:hypothetical protein
MRKIITGFCRPGRFQNAGFWYGFAAFILLAVFSGCPHPTEPDIGGNEPPAGTTFIQFDNSRGMFPVSVYTSPDRQGDSKVADLDARMKSNPIAWIPQSSGASFYFSYTLSIQNIQLLFVPPDGKDVVSSRIDEGKTTNIPLPPPEQVVSGNEPLCGESYVAIKNQGANAFRLQQGDIVIGRDDYPASLVNAGETGIYNAEFFLKCEFYGEKTS